MEQPALAEAINRLWARFHPEMIARVALLETAAAAFAENSLTFPQQQAANSAAHKLAGVLGTFSLTKGTVLARELEVMFSRESGPDPEEAKSLTSIAAELRTIVESRK
jgi:HPt (histidine-containing phosphotransfer) domain-containing protein